MTQATQSLPQLQGRLLWLLRLEGAALLVAAAGFYAHFGQSWWLFLVLSLVPDLSMLGYLAGPRVGALAYNSVHTTLPPFALLGIGALAGSRVAMAIAAIWLAHIGLDRLLGYGLKHASAFSDTHLGRIGRRA